jgi:hypothetical protein
MAFIYKVLVMSLSAYLFSGLLRWERRHSDGKFLGSVMLEWGY